VSAALLTGVLVACTDEAVTLPEASGPVVSATLTAELTRTESALTWTYRLRNDEPAEIAVFSGDPADDNPAGRAPTTTAWVVPRDDDTVEVSQRLLAPPPNVGLYRYYTQFGVVLPARGELTGSATVPLPLTVSHPYKSVFKPPLRLPDAPRRVVFCLGVARVADAPPRRPPPAWPVRRPKAQARTLRALARACGPTAPRAGST